MLYSARLCLRSLTAAEISVKVKQFHDDCKVSSSFYPVIREEYFIEHSAYLSLNGAQLNVNTYNAEIDLRKSDTGCGTMFGIPARSDVFQHRNVRDSENVPTLNIEYRCFGEE